MARIRTIKPEFWTDEKIVQLPFSARLFFIGLWNFADDEGFLDDEPERLRMQIMPNDQVDVDGLIDLLECAGLIGRYVYNNDHSRQAIKINRFLDHQRISNPTPSRVLPEVSRKTPVPLRERRAIATKYGCEPGQSMSADCYYCGMRGQIIWHRLSNGKPSSWVQFSGLEIDHFVSENQGGSTQSSNLVLACRECNRSKGTMDGVQFSTGDLFAHSHNFGQNSRRTPRGLREDSTLERKGREGNNKMAMSMATRVQIGFDEFWAVWVPGRKDKRKRAEAAWSKAIKTTDPKIIIDAAKRFAQANRDTEKRFVPMAATWLNDERWNDESAQPARRENGLSDWQPEARGVTEADRAAWQPYLDRAARIDRGLTKAWLADLVLDGVVLRAKSDFVVSRLRGELAGFLDNVGAGKFEIKTGD